MHLFNNKKYKIIFDKMEGMKLIADVLVFGAAIFLILKGFGGGDVPPFLLGLIGILMIVELITDLLFHNH